MKINITNLYGFAHTSAAWLAQNTMAQLARTEGINELGIRQLLVCNIPNFARLFVMTSASICACNPTKLRA